MMMIVTIQMIGASVKMMINRPYSGHSDQEAFHGAELQKRADRADQSVLIFPGRC